MSGSSGIRGAGGVAIDFRDTRPSGENCDFCFGVLQTMIATSNLSSYYSMIQSLANRTSR